MELKIKNTTPLKEVQSEFNKLYPYLKIEFAARKDAQNRGKWQKLSPATTFKQVLQSEKGVAINVSSYRTVADIEKDFKDSTGLSIQLYRKSGNVWIETSLTDDWTLERQNQSGEILSYSS
jgi:hypothetical protein